MLPVKHCSLSSCPIPRFPFYLFVYKPFPIPEFCSVVIICSPNIVIFWSTRCRVYFCSFDFVEIFMPMFSSTRRRTSPFLIVSLHFIPSSCLLIATFHSFHLKIHVYIHRVSKKLCKCYFLNNSVKHWLIVIIFGMRHREENWRQQL